MSVRPVNPHRIEVDDRTRAPARVLVFAVRLIRGLVEIGRSIATFVRSGNEKAR